jgi:hypothetical protein
MADKLPQDLTDEIARKENAEDKAAMNKYLVEPVKKAGKRLYENVMGTPEQNEAAQKRMDEAKKKVDRSPKYSDSQMESTRKLLDDQRKAFKPEYDKISEDYDKAKSKKAGGVIRSSASKRADGIAVKGKTRGRIV